MCCTPFTSSVFDGNTTLPGLIHGFIWLIRETSDVNGVQHILQISALWPFPFDFSCFALLTIAEVFFIQT
jgi:hypothetical protein